MTRRAVAPVLGTALAGLTILPRHVLGGPGYVAPSDKLNIAGVGVGAMGGNYLQNCESENIVALADVDHMFAAKTLARYPKAATYHDYRIMLEKEKSIDAVIIGTPDHTHAVVAMAAIGLGKHIYCAKPMTRTIYECRTVTRAAREAKVATQMSTQSCASENACAAEEIIQSGALGPVREVHVWTDRPVWPQGLMRPAETPPVPANLKWDLWLGPAPERPYHPLYHPFNWRGWYDFGTGALGDMALHTFHLIFRALKLTYPTNIASSQTLVALPAEPGQGDADWNLINRVKYQETFPHSSMVTWDFPARGGLPPVRLHWYDGGLKPPPPVDLDPTVRMPPEGSYYVGERGVLMITGAGGGTESGRGTRSASVEGADGSRGADDRAVAASPQTLIPTARFKDFTSPPKTVPRTIGHYQEWIAAAKGGPPANCNFEFARLIAETALLGVISQRTGKRLVWDAPGMRFLNDAEPNQYVNLRYRDGWSL